MHILIGSAAIIRFIPGCYKTGKFADCSPYRKHSEKLYQGAATVHRHITIEEGAGFLCENAFSIEGE